MDLSVVIPVYNEEPNVVPLVDELDAVMRGIGRSYEIVIVDDGSRDGTQAALRELARQRPNVKAVLMRRNFGQSAAFDAGFSHASGDIVITMDGDLQNDPKDIPALLAKLEEGEGYDLVSGWRRARQDASLRTIASRIANWLIRRITGVPVHDLGCSLKIYRADIARELRLYGEMHRLAAVLADGMGARIAELVVNHRARRAGKSKYGLGRVAKVLLDLTTVWFMRSYQTKPIYVFGGGGLLLVGTSALVAGFVLWQKLAYGAWVHRNPLFIIAVLLFLVGVQSIGTGLIAEIVVRTYFEARGRPAYAVRETIGIDRSALVEASAASPSPPPPDTTPAVAPRVPLRAPSAPAPGTPPAKIPKGPIPPPRPRG